MGDIRLLTNETISLKPSQRLLFSHSRYCCTHRFEKLVILLLVVSSTVFLITTALYIAKFENLYCQEKERGCGKSQEHTRGSIFWKLWYYLLSKLEAVLLITDAHSWVWMARNWVVTEVLLCSSVKIAATCFMRVLIDFCLIVFLELTGKYCSFYCHFFSSSLL